MSSMRKKAAVVVDNLPIETSKGNVLDYIHHKFFRDLSARECKQVVEHLIETGQVEFSGSPKRPTSLYARKAS